MAKAGQPETWITKAPASAAALSRLIARAGGQLPVEYVAFLRRSDGAEGELDIDPRWIQLWGADEALELNDAYEVARNVPGFFAFGSNGGGEMLAFDRRGNPPYPVVMIPFIPMQADHSQPVASCFDELSRHFGRPGV